MRKGAQGMERQLRADATRNRTRILEAAKLAFTEHGADAGLDEIAKQAGVGSATLYRHFPTREFLIEAVYRADVEKLAAAARILAQESDPVDALRSWMLLFVDYISSKQIIAPALNSVPGGSVRLYENSSDLVLGAVGELIERAIRSGAISSDVRPWDFLQPLIGASLVQSGQDWPASARRLVHLLVRGATRN